MVTKNGAIKLFDAFGINVYLHWTWFAAAVFLFQRHHSFYRQDSYLWCALEYIALFGIVLLHEFGHSLACRQVGGVAHEIVLWPLGGVAYVSPPQRPGAELWSIAAGPLVNVALIPVFLVLDWAALATGVAAQAPNTYVFITSLEWINIQILIFNLLPLGLLESAPFVLRLLPIYPLDGGQMLRALLWFIFGRGRSLLIASGLGLIGVVGLGVMALQRESIWLGLIAFMAFSNCWSGLQQARAMVKFEAKWHMPDKPPLRFGFACPSCRNAPPVGTFWICSQCQTPFDTFETGARCPSCATTYATTRCQSCGGSYPIANWRTVPPPPPGR